MNSRKVMNLSTPSQFIYTRFALCSSNKPTLDESARMVRWMFATSTHRPKFCQYRFAIGLAHTSICGFRFRGTHLENCWSRIQWCIIKLLLYFCRDFSDKICNCYKFRVLIITIFIKSYSLFTNVWTNFKFKRRSKYKWKSDKVKKS